MLTNQEPDRNIEDLTDTEMYDAIHDLESNPRRANQQHPRSTDEHDDSGVLICVGFMILLFGRLAFILLYWK